MNNGSSVSSKIYLITIILIFIILSGTVGYFFGRTENKNNVVVPENQAVTISSTPIPIANNDNWGNFSQEFMNGYTFEISYPLDKNHTPFIFNAKDSGWPISPIERLFTTNIAFGDYRLGISDIDPTTCKDSCKSAIDEITKSDEVILDKISSKRIRVLISNKGGGAILPGKPSESLLYIIPYQNKFIILYSFYPDAGFEKFVSSFKVQHN